MRFSEAWLRTWVDPPLSAEELGERLTMAGLELDGIEPAAPPFEGVVVAEVKSVVPHPNADRLRVCEVDAGADEPLQVVCGAPNVAVEMRAPLARVGATLPGGLRVKPARLRGVESYGMLCSAQELGLAESAEGLMRLPDDAPIGASLREYLGLDDKVIEVDLTPNRGDCLSISGIAREVATLTAAELHTLQVDPVPPGSERVFGVDVQARQACPHYAGRVIEAVDPTASTPLWMQERLRRSGIRSLGPLVDITNYVMLELGQPMHAFDLDRLHGAIEVRYARVGESLALLDDQELELAPDVLVIADVDRPVALAGVMGGRDSGVDESTRNLFLECAFFSPEVIAGKARRYGRSTDSAYRFERGVDPALQVPALERATALMVQIAGGRAGPVVNSVAPEYLPKRSPIVLRRTRFERVLGVSLADAEVERILRTLGCEVEPGDGVWHVVPPGYRFDLELEADLVEELGRVYGYDRIPVTHPRYETRISPQPESQVGLERIRDRLVDLGYQEAITFSFVDAGLEALLNPGYHPKALANPLSRDLAVMRTTLWSGLIPAVRRNLNRQQTRVRLFEVGLRFLTEGDRLRQVPTLAGVITGSPWPEQWGMSHREVDFFDLKGDVEGILALLSRDEVAFRPATRDALHPGQSATIHLNDTPVGSLGALHPELESRLDLGQRLYLFELDLEVFRHARVPEFRSVSRFPAIRRDISIVVDASVTAAQIVDTLKHAGIDQLKEVRIFDVYAGKGVTSGRKSIALGLILQDLSRTLTDQEVEALVSGLVNRLQRDFGAILRA